MKKSYNATIKACFTGFVIQAIVNNFAPLLFLTFQAQYGIDLSKITLLVTFNFLLQLSVDLFSAFFVDKIGYRAAAVCAHVFSAAGLLLLAVLPEVFPDVKTEHPPESDGHAAVSREVEENLDRICCRSEPGQGQA